MGGCGVSAIEYSRAHRMTWSPNKLFGDLPNDDLFHRLETVRFFRLFTGEGDMENTGRGNTEPRGLKAKVLP